MILFLQFTITDTRKFSNYRDQVLKNPQWPNPKPFGQFVRAAGSIVERKKGGLSGWIGENFICQINNSIKFPAKIPFTNGVTASNVSKHMYANGTYVLTKYEFVFNIRTKNLGTQVTYDTMKTIINELLLSQVQLRLKGKIIELPVHEMPEALCEFHYQNSTLRDSTKYGDSEGRQNILSCTPQCYFYLEKGEFSTGLDKNFTHIPNFSKVARLFGGWHDHRKSAFRIWIHQRQAKSPKVTENRQIRMQIMRLHSEYECLRNLLGAIMNKFIFVEERSAVSDDLQEYFNTAIKSFLIDEQNVNYLSWKKHFLNYFSKVYALASKGESENLRSQIDSFNFRANIKNKVLTLHQTFYMSEKTFNNFNSPVASQGDNNIVQVNHVGSSSAKDGQDINFDELIEELTQLIAHQRDSASTTEDFQALSALSQVRDAAEKKDSNAVVTALKVGGKVLYEVGTKFTANLLIELMKGTVTL